MNEFEEKLLEKLEDIRKELSSSNEYMKLWTAWRESLDPDLEYRGEKLDEKGETLCKSSCDLANHSSMAQHTDSKPQIEVREETIQKGKYTWYPLKDGGKVRKCNNAPCPYYLKWNDEKKTYEHGKYEPEKMRFYYVDDRCEFYGGR